MGNSAVQTSGAMEGGGFDLAPLVPYPQVLTLSQESFHEAHVPAE